jgi:amino acid adenylation domain-containing protein
MTTRHAFPASFGQRRLWFLDQFEPASAAYNVPIAMRIAGALDADAIERSLAAVVEHHEALRTRFELEEGEPAQVIVSELAVPLAVVDLTDTPAEQREARAQEILSEESLRPFDLARGPLIRATLLRLAPADHVLLLTLHHIVCDGWSLGILLRELSSVYNELVSGRPAALPALEIQYADYSVWLREWLEGGELQRQLAYWKQQLSAVPVLQLQTDRPRPLVWSSKGAKLPIALPLKLADEVSAIARKERATPFMALLAAFQALLQRYTSQDDIAVGSPIAGRNRVEVEPLIGFFVNTLVLRTNLSGDPTFRELLARVRDVTLGAFTHQDVPFEKLVEELRPERATTHTPFFQTMFVLQNTTPALLDIEGTKAAPYELLDSTAKFEISMSLRNTGDGLRGTIEYNTDLFDRSTIQRMAAHFEQLLEGICANPDARVSALPLLTASERQQIDTWNATSVDLPPLCLHQLFEAQVARTPDAIAVVSGNDSISYRTLNARANRLARTLRSAGVGPDVVAGVCLDRSVDVVVALLGILKSGAAYLPLDPSYPEVRLTAMLEDSATTVVVTDTVNGSTLPAGLRRLTLGGYHEATSADDESNVDSQATLDSLAYLLFTSGSTGRPKGVMIPHRAVCNYVRWMQSAYKIGPDERILQRTPMSFDLSVWEFYLPLISGGTLVMAPAGGDFEPDELVDVITTHEVTAVQLVPSLLGLLLDEPSVSRCKTVRRMFSGGAALTPALRDRFFDTFGWASLHNQYGPTETCINSLAWTCPPGDRTPMVPIGKPIANTLVYVLGPGLELLPVGAVGELFIGGAGLAHGYINRPDLTAERFLADPFAGGDARMYRTGDRVRYLPDGNVAYLGRNDDQVKVRGVRIELQEVGAALARHDDVQQCVVVARDDVAGEAQLVAYYVARDQQPADAELRRFLRDTLPDSMVPTRFVRLDALPLAPNGKIDRRALPAPVFNRTDAADRFVSPRTDLEKSMAGVWRQVLHIDTIGVHDNFFDLGGHSLLAVQMVTKIRTECGLDLPLRALFEAPTIAGLAARVASNERPASECLVPLQPAGTKAPFFCIHGVGGEVQAYAELARQLDPDRPFFGVRAPTYDDSQRWPTIEALAARYIAEIRSAFPKGPYFLGGYSAGSTLAYEMAQQLTASGEEVLLVVALDSRLPNTLPPAASPSAWLDAATNLWWWTIDDLMEANPHEIAARFKSKAAMLARKLSTVPGLGWLRPESEADIRDVLGIPWVPKEWVSFLEQLFASHKAYKPRVYAGRVALFRARTRPLFRLWEPDLGWSKLAKGGVEVHTVRGSHSNMLREPNVQLLAKALRQSMDTAEHAGS